MSKTIPVKKLQSGDYLLSAYGRDDRLLITDYEIHNQKSIDRLKEFGVIKATVKRGEKSRSRKKIADLEDVKNIIKETASTIIQTKTI